MVTRIGRSVQFSLSIGQTTDRKNESRAVICQVKNENKNFPWQMVVFFEN